MMNLNKSFPPLHAPVLYPQPVHKARPHVGPDAANRYRKIVTDTAKITDIYIYIKTTEHTHTYDIYKYIYTYIHTHNLVYIYTNFIYMQEIEQEEEERI